MPRRATKDTFAHYELDDGIDVRVQVVAGQEIPDHFVLEDDSAAEEHDNRRGVAYKDEQVTKRFSRTEDGGLKTHYEPEKVEREFESSQRKQAKGDQELGDEPLNRRYPEVDDADKTAKEGDRINEEMRAREREKSPAARLNERLGGGEGGRRQQRGRRADQKQAEGEGPSVKE